MQCKKDRNTGLNDWQDFFEKRIKKARYSDGLLHSTFIFAHMQSIHEDQTFSKISIKELTSAQSYEHCKFLNCNFANAYLDGLVFMDCVFEDCNLLLASVGNTGFQNVLFKRCKLSGLNFGKARDFLFEVHFEGCILDNAIFYQKKNKKGRFTDCSMVETDLTEADLSDAKFINCNLHRAFFSRTILKSTDLRSSYNFSIDPDDNVIKKAHFSLHGLPGLLGKYDIKVD